MAFTALSAGVSGLTAFTEGIGVIADNITNVNTIGFKESRSRFSTLVTETAAISSFSPGGVRSFTDTLISRQGLLQPSNSATDLSIDGPGFFIVRDAGPGGVATDQSGEILYTRAGSFTQDPQGFFRNTAGFTLLGYPIDGSGNLPTNLNDVNSLVPININDLNGFGDDTNNVKIRANFQASTAVTAGYTTGDLASGTTQPDFQSNFQVFDSLGRGHTVTMSAVKTDVNTWSYEMAFDDPAQLDGAHVDGLIGSGEMVFNSDGTIDLASTTFNDITGTAVALPGGALSFDFDTSATGPDAVDVEPGSIVFDFGDDGGSNGFTQFDSPSVMISSSADGASFENVAGVSINEAGEVTAIFDNGLTLTVYQLPVATFPNPNGLERRQGNAYSISDVSGDAAFQLAGNGGAGKISPNSLELSTVDLANEFSEMIRVQRAFSASSRIITTADEILTELTQLV